jgi:hypothetical protein
MIGGAVIKSTGRKLMRWLNDEVVRILVPGLAALLFLTGPSHATTLATYTTRASFTAAINLTQIESFESFTTNVPFHTVPIDVGAFTISLTAKGKDSEPDDNQIALAPAGTLEVDVNGTNNMRVFTTNNPQSNLVVSFDTPITAFGADFRSFNDVENRTAIVVDGVTIAPPIGDDDFLHSFFGITSTVAFTTVTFVGLQNDVFGIDNVTFATVPEPSTLALAALGALGLLFAARRKR